MLKILKSKKAQASASEYVIMISMIIAAFTVMTVYINRALQASIRNASVSIVDKARTDAINYYNGFLYYQYEPYYLNYVSNVARDSKTRRGLTQDGISTHFVNFATSVSTSSTTAPAKDYKLTGEH